MFGRKFTIKGLLLILIAVSFLALNIAPARAQENDECAPEEVKEWLYAQQAWRNATNETIDKVIEAEVPWLALTSILKEFNRHVQAIADLSRPVCANEIMLNIYDRYNAFEQFWICQSQNDETCVYEMGRRIRLQDNWINTRLRPLFRIAGITSTDFDSQTIDLRPEGWTWPPDALKRYFPTPYAEGALDFEAEAILDFVGNGEMVSDPVTIPEGIYRVSLETQDMISVEMIVLAGECYVGNSTWDTTVFGYRGNGAQSLITSKGCDVLWQVEYARSPFKLSFEKIR